MKRIFSALKINMALMLALSVIAGCSTGGLTDPEPTNGTPSPAYVDLLVSSPQLDSDDSSSVTLTAVVKDSQMRAIADQKVFFSATSGIVKNLSGGGGEEATSADQSAVTDASGTATAELGTGGDPSSRTITLSATAGGASSTNAVTVTGTNISIDPPAFSLPYNYQAGKEITVSLKNSAGAAIVGKTVTLASGTGNSLFTPSGPYTTDNSGQVKVTVTNLTDTQKDTLTASSIGVSAQATLTINTARLTVGVPSADAQVDISTNQPFTVTYTENDAPVAGKTIYFSTTRGALTASSGVTNASGTATVYVSSENSGPAVLTAYTTGDPQASAQVSIIFVAKTATKMDLSASPAKIDTNAAGQTGEQSLIKAVVRDGKDNLVMGMTVNFAIIQDASAGYLSNASAETDMYGLATVNYIAGGAPSGLNNVIIRATVVDAPAVTRTTTLTVGDQALFITLATGPTVTKVDPNKYQKDYLALVTDAAGNPVADAVVTGTVTPLWYKKGYWDSSNGKSWVQINTLASSLTTDPVNRACANEDGMTHNPLYDYNGVLDTGEDQNANSRLEPGNVASVTATATDSTGHSTVSLSYARDYAYWVNVRLEVRAGGLHGSTASAVQYFNLPGASTDYTSLTVDPPGNPSPFGSNSTCYAALTLLRSSNTKIILKWDPSAYAVSYNIYRAVSATSPASRIATTTQPSYEDTVAGGTYCYEVWQVDVLGVETPLAMAGNRVCTSTAIPSPPGSVTATAISSSQIQVSWEDAGASAYRIYQGGVWLQDSVTRTIVSSGLMANTQYCYTVSSLDSAGNESSQSGTACATTQLNAPPTPTNLTATATSSDSITLTWTASSGAKFYNIYKNGAHLLCGTGTTAVDTDVDPQSCYCYTVSAVNNTGTESGQSAQFCVCTEQAPPPAPIGLLVTATGSTSMSLSWTAVTGAASYKVYRNGTSIGTTTSTVKTDTGLTAGTTYCYTVTALDSLGNESDQSAQECAATDEAPLAAPTNLVATPQGAGTGDIKLTWTAVTGAVEYEVYRDGVSIGTSAVQSYLDLTGVSGTDYVYQVIAEDADGDRSAPSAEVPAKAP